MKNFNIKHRELEKIKAEAEKTTFFERMQPFIFVIKYFLLPCLIIWSIVTETTFLGTQFYSNTNSMIVTTLLTILLVGLIEISKLSIGSVFIKLFTHRHISEGWHYVIFAIPIFLWFLMSFGSSAYLSIQGSKYTAQNIKELKGYSPVVNVDSINQVYNTRLNAIQKNIKKSQRTTWKGNITQSAMASIRQYNSQIETLEKSRSNEIALARNENAIAKTSIESRTQNWGLWLGRIGGFSEILTILVMIILTLFTYISMQELETPKVQRKNPTRSEMRNATLNPVHVATQSPTMNATSQNVVAQQNVRVGEDVGEIATPTRRPIGFEIPTTNATIKKNTTTVDLTNSVKNIGTYYKRSITTQDENRRAYQRSVFEKMARELIKYDYVILTKELHLVKKKKTSPSFEKWYSDFSEKGYKEHSL